MTSHLASATMANNDRNNMNIISGYYTVYSPATAAGSITEINTATEMRHC